MRALTKRIFPIEVAAYMKQNEKSWVVNHRESDDMIHKCLYEFIEKALSPVP